MSEISVIIATINRAEALKTNLLGISLISQNKYNPVAVRETGLLDRVFKQTIPLCEGGRLHCIANPISRRFSA